MRRLIATALFVAPLALGVPLHAAALQTPTTGQPGAPTNTCGPDNPVTPGNAANSPGSPFNAAGRAGQVYAGNPGTASLANSNSAAAVSQYDAACVRLSH
jgi:hypothetical protein